MGDGLTGDGLLSWKDSGELVGFVGSQYDVH